MGARVDEFTGTAGEYIKYLEGTVSSLRQRSCTCHTRVSQTPNNETVAAPPQQPPTRSVDSTPRSDHGSMSVEHGRKEAQLLTPPGKRTFEIYQWHPEHAPEPKTKHGHVENGQPFWKRTAQTLVDTTPDAQNWWQIVEDLGVYSAMRHGCVADFLLDINQQTPSVDYAGNAILPGLIDDRNSQLLSQVMAYASAARARDQTASFALMLVNFQKFLLLSTCAVLHDLGVVKEAIIDVVKVGFGNSTDNHSWRLVQTAVFLNKRVQTLNSNGWRDRASELLLIWNHPPSFYYSLARAPDASLSYLRNELSKQRFHLPMDSDKHPTPLIVTTLVHLILGKRVHSARISHVLGYRHEDLLVELGAQERVNPFRFFNTYQNHT